MADYLTRPIAELKRTAPPKQRMTRDGYTKRSGSPTDTLIRLQGEKTWRRVMAWQFSNMPTCFVRIGGKNLIVPHGELARRY